MDEMQDWLSETLRQWAEDQFTQEEEGSEEEEEEDKLFNSIIEVVEKIEEDQKLSKKDYEIILFQLYAKFGFIE